MAKIRWGRCPESRPGAEEALTPRQREALAHLSAAGCLTSGLVADLLQVDKPRARRTLLGLRNRGLAVRAEVRLRVRGRTKWVRVWFPAGRPRPETAAEAEKALVLGLVYAVLTRERPDWRLEGEHITKPDGVRIRVAVGPEGAADLRVLREGDPVPAGRFARAAGSRAGGLPKKGRPCPGPARVRRIFRWKEVYTVIDLAFGNPLGDAARLLAAAAALLPLVVALAVVLTGLPWVLGAFRTAEGRMLAMLAVLVAAGLGALMTHAWAENLIAPARLVQADLGLGRTLNQILNWRW